MPQQPSSRPQGRFLFTPEELKPGRTILVRLGLILVIFLAVFLIMWLDRDGMQDKLDGEISFTDIVYFSMITITTVGYGDIVPVTPRARLIDALLLTPIRFFIWFLFLGTAYQIAARRYMEDYKMITLQAQLRDHVIVCGLGHTGLSAVKEMLAKGKDPKQILVIEADENRVRRANEQGVIAFRGDASQESVLKEAILEKARAVIVSAGRDDTNALILLTARHMNPAIRLIVSAKEEENIKLFRQGGASAIISPASFGGYLVAAAVEQTHCIDYFEDLLTSGGRVNLVQRPVRPQEIGKTAADLLPEVLLRVYREGAILSFWDFQQDREHLKENDTLLLIQQVPQSQ